jgi:hypothetical protein
MPRKRHLEMERIISTWLVNGNKIFSQFELEVRAVIEL